MELTFYDTTILSLGALFLGIIMLIKGGNWAVDSAVFVANRYGISPMVIGFTIIAFGTSLPELVVSVAANFQGSPGIALGNVLGSNIANILLVLGCSSLFMTLSAKVNKELIRDLGLMLVASFALAGLLYNGEISRLVGIAMLAVLGTYVFIQYISTKNEEFELEELEDVMFKNGYFAAGTLIIGLICIAVGSEFLVKGAKVSAGLMEIPESVIALSIVAFGTSLPELSTSIIAARKNQAGMVIGNIIGSNVFNILMILGAAAASKPILQGSFSPQLGNFDVWITLAVTIIFAIILFLTGKISRITGSFFFLSYICYNIYIYMVNITPS